MFAVSKKGRVRTLPFLYPYKFTFCENLYLEVEPSPPLRLAVALSSYVIPKGKNIP